VKGKGCPYHHQSQIFVAKMQFNIIFVSRPGNSLRVYTDIKTLTIKNEAQTALFKDQARTAQSTLFISVIKTKQL
jgi:hypothetical protein